MNQWESESIKNLLSAETVRSHTHAITVLAKSILTLLAGCAKERGATLLMSSHQPGLVREYVDRIIALDGGQVAYDGPSDELDDNRLLRIYGDKIGQAKLELVA